MKQRENQSKRILRLLRENVNQWVPLPQILDLRISQYSARIWTLRRQGHRIENHVARHGNQTRSWFRLVERGQARLFEPPLSESRREHVLEIQRTNL